VVTLVDEIATASNEQSSGLAQITTGLTQIDEVTQANTASAEETASASAELAGLADRLKSMVAGLESEKQLIA
jgi:methyl-accepting chemotaxis protein